MPEMTDAPEPGGLLFFLISALPYSVPNSRHTTCVFRYGLFGVQLTKEVQHVGHDE
jgi:hypothetical protein